MSDDEGFTPVAVAAMDDDELQIGKDLIRHAIQKIEQVVTDFLELQDNPQFIYMLNTRVLRFFMQGQKLFDLSGSPTERDTKRDTNERIILGTVIPLLMALSDNGSEECGHLIERIGTKEFELDHREILRFLAQLS